MSPNPVGPSAGTSLTAALGLAANPTVVVPASAIAAGTGNPLNTDYCGAGAYLPYSTSSSAPQNDIGLLMDVSSDSSGMHVYAVGLGSALMNPPILYSGNGGVTWVTQASAAGCQRFGLPPCKPRARSK